jgi:membrane protein DedA with SNARE-associated domain
MIVEGPIISVISGFLAYLGYLNIFVLYPLLVLGDLIGDSLYYSIGKYFSKLVWIKKIATRLGYSEEKEEFIKNHFKKHAIKTLFIAKISHGLGIPVQISAGIAKVKFFKYVSVELVATMIKTLVLLVVGFYLGDSYMKINGYLHFFAFALVALAVLVILYFILNKYAKNYFK